MKKIEDILRKHGWLFRVVLFALFFFWACQLAGPAKESMKKNAESYKNWDFNKARETMQEFYEFRGELYDKAKAKGNNYSPSMYFTDVAAIEKKEKELKVNENPYFQPQSCQNEFYNLMITNMIRGHFTRENLEEAKEKFRKENQRAYSQQLGFAYKIKPVDWSKAPSWIKTFYLRVTWIVLILYLIRVAERSGTILGTILADKKKFLLAILLWPVYFFKYPYNVVREIRVEAELRRLKGLFRVFTVKESRLVREVANSSYYKQWLFEFRLQNRGSFKRGLFLALMATLFLHLLVLSTPRASEKRVRSPGLMFCQAKVQNETQQNLTEDTTEDNNPVEEWGIPPEIGLPDPPLLMITVKFLKQIVQSRQPDTIDRIPRTSLFGNLTRVINQTRKGITNEYGQKDNLLGCLTIWNDRKCVWY